MFTAIFLSYSAAHLIIAISLVRLLLKRGYIPGAIFVAFVSFSLVFDNSMIALGDRIGPGEQLLTLSLPRFYIHAAFTPFLMIVAWFIAERAGLTFTQKRPLYYALWLLVLGLSAYGIYVDLAGGLELQLACVGDTIRYTSSAPPAQFCSPDQLSLPGHGPPIPSIATVIVSIAIGAALLRSTGWPWLLVTAAIMLVAAGAPKTTLGPTFGNLGEVILQAGFAATLWRFSRPESPA